MVIKRTLSNCSPFLVVPWKKIASQNQEKLKTCWELWIHRCKKCWFRVRCSCETSPWIVYFLWIFHSMLDLCLLCILRRENVCTVCVEFASAKCFLSVALYYFSKVKSQSLRIHCMLQTRHGKEKREEFRQVRKVWEQESKYRVTQGSSQGPSKDCSPSITLRTCRELVPFSVWTNKRNKHLLKELLGGVGSGAGRHWQALEKSLFSHREANELTWALSSSLFSIR